MHALSLAEATVGHRVARQHALPILDHIIDDRSRGVNLLLPGHRHLGVVVAILAGAHHLGNQLFALLAQQQNNSPIRLHMLEDQIHHHFQNLIDLEIAPQRRPQLMQDLQRRHRRGRRLRHGQHH